ncbi:MAG: glutamate synthase subunit alpha, partial [cyanobacterium endosymbiont of Rhopalodia yunnanensis]
IRSILAKLGYYSLNEVIGRSDLLISRKKLKLTKTQTLNLDCLIKLPNVKEDRSWLNHEAVHSNGEVLDDRILADQEIISSIDEHRSVTKNVKIVNTDRTVGARISGVIAKKYGNTGLKGKLTLNFKGTSGQSFGAFNLPGMILYLEGEANDYVGKGMHGGEIVIVPHKESNYKPEDSVIIGNTCLYGSTGGFLYANGRAGERFGVRNSLGKAVIEGAGDHCCEYMTGGVIVVLGTIGRNVSAGMTGGIGYFLDEEGNFPEKVNFETVEIQRICTEAGKFQLKGLIQSHVDRTRSQKGQIILDNWEDYVSKFWQVFPLSEANSPEINSNPVTVEEKTLTPVK